MSDALDAIAEERNRQINEEGWTCAHDDEHSGGEMADAAACYALSSDGRRKLDAHDIGLKRWPPVFWPWSNRYWKPKTRDRDLIRAGALIVAELERIKRAEIHERLAAIYETADELHTFLHSPQHLLAGDVPQDLIDCGNFGPILHLIRCIEAKLATAPLQEGKSGE